MAHTVQKKKIILALKPKYFYFVTALFSSFHPLFLPSFFHFSPSLLFYVFKLNKKLALVSFPKSTALAFISCLCFFCLLEVKVDSVSSTGYYITGLSSSSFIYITVSTLKLIFVVLNYF